MKKDIIPIIVDIEASGFGSDSYPIEIGLIDDKGNRYCSLIKPLPDWTHWSESAEAVHGISRREIETHGKDPREIAIEINRRLVGTTVYSDGWAHDYPWLRKLFYAALKEPEFRFSPIEMILTEAQIGIWDETKRRIIESTTAPRHRASTDAYIIQQTWLKSRMGI
ncbi:MAG: hypothetical protein AseanaTS_16150 [Candidatus Pelagadaptatus aseana]|uniref:3'-5' exonuclease n=1 Tax=Candidatus Pelagadaptatus aseana TaxID=3120508 RepID=UPI0039B2DEAD